MKITYFNYLWDLDGISSGSTNKAREFIWALERKGFQIAVNWQTKQPSSDIKSNWKIKWRGILRRYLQRFLKEPKRLLLNSVQFISEWRIINRQKPDILFERLELYYFAAAILAKIKRIPLVVEVDAPPFYEYKTFYGKDNLHIPFLPEFTEWLTLRLADSALIISNALKDYYLERGVPEEKMIVIPNGADPKRFYPQPRNKDIEKRHNLKGKIVVGWIGTRFGWSGIENLLGMVNTVINERKDVTFLFVGGGESESFFKEHFGEAVAQSRVLLPGTIPYDDVNDYLSCMDIVLAPYPKLDFWYASSVKIFEYMAAGKAVLASRVGQIAEVICDGYNGRLYNPDSSEELIEKITQLIQKQRIREAMGREARKTMLEQYTWDGHAERMKQVFYKVYSEYHRSRNPNSCPECRR
jgi:glycosyltransferase involved in cell wall biosynthesis